jgi:signal transduction histidine kinase
MATKPILPTENQPIRVLLMEDNSRDLLMLRMMLADIKGLPFDISVVDGVAQGLDALAKKKFDIVLLSLAFKESKGIDSLLQIQAKAPQVPVVILAGLEDQAMAFDAVKKGAQDYVIKGKLDANLLSRVIHYAIERHRVMEEMREQNKELERLNSLKSEFVSTVSHELRTPLTVVLSATNNLLDGAFGALNEPQNKWLKKISYHALRLHGMISDILDLSKLQSGKADMRREQVDVAKLFKAALTHLSMLTKEKKIKLTHSISADLPVIWGDPGRLEQVLTNLVTNAIKFTPAEGHIEVTIEKEEEQIGITVADSGMGIPAEQQEEIFQRFHQIRTTDKDSSTQGIGLGLAICREIVIQHRGHIWVESEVGKGSRFKFLIPIEARSSVDRPLDILVVDDDEGVCELLTMALTQAGFHVTSSKNGKHAIQLIQEKEGRFDLVFLDLMLPGASGVEIIKHIRQLKKPSEIVVITAYPNSDMLFEGMATGPLTIIAKPFNTDSVIELARKIKPASASKSQRRAA